MAKVFCISDLHFGHKNLILNLRGFSSVEEHDELIISNWNKVVSKRDKVFIAGDIRMENNEYWILDRLNGNKTVILGNHELGKHVPELLKYVDKVAGAISYKGYMITHIPIHPSEFEHCRGNIHGHVHSYSLPDPRYFNISCEVLNYTPIEFEELTKKYNDLLHI